MGEDWDCMVVRHTQIQMILALCVCLRTHFSGLLFSNMVASAWPATVPVDRPSALLEMPVLSLPLEKLWGFLKGWLRHGPLSEGDMALPFRPPLTSLCGQHHLVSSVNGYQFFPVQRGKTGLCSLCFSTESVTRRHKKIKNTV